MIVRAINSDNGWLYGKGRNDYKKDLSAVSQNIQTRLQSFLGNCFFALDSGVDWFHLLGAKDQRALRLAISSCILNTTNVTGILVLTYSLSQGRNLLIQYRAQTIYGETQDTFQYSIGA